MEEFIINLYFSEHESDDKLCFDFEKNKACRFFKVIAVAAGRILVTCYPANPIWLQLGSVQVLLTSSFPNFFAPTPLVS